MYRAVTFKVLEEKVDPTDTQKVFEVANSLQIKFVPSPEKTLIFLNQQDVSDKIRTSAVTKMIRFFSQFLLFSFPPFLLFLSSFIFLLPFFHIFPHLFFCFGKKSPIAANVKVREVMVEKQREMGKEGGIVMDGRDIGTVVFPDAELKIFMVASAQVRAERRVEELKKNGENTPLQEVLQDILKRDKADEERQVGPLKQAQDAILLDTSQMDLSQQNQALLDLAIKAIQKINSL